MLEVNDVVLTSKGCRVSGNPGPLVVIDTERTWKHFEAVLCRKVNGQKKLFLAKNLTKIAHLKDGEDVHTLSW